MYALNINKSAIESLAKEVFDKNPIPTNSEFYRFLKEQKIKQDLKQSIIEAENGNFLDEDDTFKKLYYELSL